MANRRTPLCPSANLGIARALPSASNLGPPAQREDRDIRRAVDPHGYIDRPHAFAHEDRRIPALADSRHHRKLTTGHRADTWQYNLSAVRVPREHERDVERRRFHEATGIVRE